MPREKFKVDAKTIWDIRKGLPGAVLTTHLQQALVDCMERPQEGKARQIVATISIVPVSEDGRRTDGAGIAISVQTRLPKSYTGDTVRLRGDLHQPQTIEAHYYPPEETADWVDEQAEAPASARVVDGTGA